MTTSGTVSKTVIDVATIIEHAFRRAGKTPADQTPDAIAAAKDNLYFYLCSLMNLGTMLWLVDKQIIGLMPDQQTYDLPSDTVDLRQVYYRTVNLAAGGSAASSAGGVAGNAFDGTLQNPCIQTAAAGNISYSFTNNRAITNVGIVPNGNQTYTLVGEYSFNNVDWYQSLSTPTQLYTAGKWTYFDITAPTNAPLYRIRETGLGILNVLQLAFNTVASEITVARLNADQYTSLTDKQFPSRNLLQYWLDRQIPNPRMWVWPVSSYAFDQMVCWRRRYIQDVGSLSNTIEVPQYWIEPIITNTACRLILELPDCDIKRYDMLKKEADASTYQAQQEERDKSPIQLAPNISCYTR